MRVRSVVSWSVLILLSAAGAVLGGNLLAERGGAYLRGLVREEANEAVRQGVQEALREDALNAARERDRIAARETAQFINAHMPTVRAFAGRNALLAHSIQSVESGKDGLYCEFGVYKGETINFIAERTPRTVHGFDSFEGLPETWRTGFEVGTFNDLTGLPNVRDNVKLHKGWFDQSIPVWAKDHPGPIAFLHQDADLYSSTKTVFDLLGDRIGPGTVIQFDEFFNYPGWQDGEYKAFMEFVAARGVKFEYLGYTAGETVQQVAVRVLRVESPKGK